MIAARKWVTSCLDWEDRIREQRSLLPDLPLYRAEADRAVRIFSTSMIVRARLKSASIVSLTRR